MDRIKKQSLYNIETSAISVIVMLFIFRPSCPFFKYPFVVFYLGFLSYFVLKYRTEIFSAGGDFLKSMALPVTLLLILLLALIFSDKTYFVILKEILNAVILFTLFFVLYVRIDSPQGLSRFTESFQRILLAFCIFISLIQLIELFDILPRHELLSKYHIFSNVLRLTDEFDYNFAVVPLLLGLIVLLGMLNNAVSLSGRVLINFLFILFSAAIFLSGSFRGLIVLVVIYAAIYLIRIFVLFNNLAGRKKLTFNFNSVIISNIIVLLALFVIIGISSGSTKTNMLEFIGSKNIREVKFNIAAHLYKYVSFVDKRTSYTQFHDRLWIPEYNPKDPDSGWGTRIHTDVYPLEGNNSGIVPKGAIGYMMDHRSDADSSDPEFIRIWSSIHLNTATAADTNYTAAIYCYASQDFDGTYARLYCSKALSYYDLKRKGTWQLLKLNFHSSKVIPVEFEWAVLRGTKIRKVKGYVIFSYPQYTNAGSSDLSYFQHRYNFASFALCDFNIFNGINSFREFDPVKRWLKNSFPEDTTYRSPRKNIVPLLAKENVINNRTLRWKFALQIFRDEFNLKDKILGGGFTYLNWFGYYFLNDKTASEFPHNPFLNILLYSGILGLILYLFLVIKVIIYYSIYWKGYSFYALSFLIVYFFTLFSGSSPFDPPVMGFFIILPFYIHSIYNHAFLHTKSKEGNFKQ